MRKVTLGVTPTPQGAKPWNDWVINALRELETASNQYATSNPSLLGNALLSSPSASANTYMLFSGATTFSFASISPFSQGLLPLTTAAAWLSAIGAQGSGSYLVTTNNLSDVASAPTSRKNLNVESRTTFGDANYSMVATDKLIATSVVFTAPRTLTLVSAASVNPGQIVYVIDEADAVGATNTLTVAVQSGQKLNGVTNGTFLNDATGSGMAFESDGSSNWFSFWPRPVLSENGQQYLYGGFSEVPYSLGTISSGSITPNPLNNLKQTLINGGAFTLNAPTIVGDIELYITNNASAGTITFSGFTKQWAGDILDTTNGHEFVIFIYCFKNNAGSVKTSYLIKAMQ